MLAVSGALFALLVTKMIDRLVGMWESRALGEISKRLWKSF